MVLESQKRVLMLLLREMWVVGTLEDEYWGTIALGITKGHGHEKEQK